MINLKNELLKRNKKNRYFPSTEINLALVVCLLGSLISCSSCNQKDNPNIALPKAVKENYVAVLPFKNNTGDSNFDPLGEMAADWITSGLHETGEGKILASGEVNHLVNRATQMKTTMNHSFSKDNRVHYLIEGSFYKMNNWLVFSSNIKQINTGEIVFNFPVIQGLEQDPMDILETLKQRILGFWVTKDRAGYEHKPPIYEAYKAYLDAGKIWYLQSKKAKSLLQKSISIDTSFHFAAFGYIHKLISHGQLEEADSMIAVYHRKKEQLNRMELEFLNGLQARITKNPIQSWKSWNTPHLMAYWGKNHVTKQKADLLLWYFNQPEVTLDLLKDIDYSTLDYEIPPSRALYFRKIDALFRLNRNKEVKEMLINPPFDIQRSVFVYSKIVYLAMMKAYPEVDQTLLHYFKNTTITHYPHHFLKGYAVFGLLNTDDQIKAKSEARKYLKTLENETDLRPAPNGLTKIQVQIALYLALQEPENATPFFEKSEGPATTSVMLTLKGIYYAQLKNVTAAKEVIKQLAALKGKFDYGETERNIALIEAWLGNHNLAITLLEKNRPGGKPLWFPFFDGDWRIKPLLDHPDFKSKLIAPIPLPETANNNPEKAQVFPVIWIFIVVLTTCIFAFFFLFRGRNYPTPEIKAHSKSHNPVNNGSINDPILEQLTNTIEKNLNDTNYSLPQICKALGISRAQLYRKIKTITGKSPAIYIRSIRLQKAKELLHNSDLNISEIAYEVGFKDVSYFSRSYSKEFGTSPSETRK